MSSITPVYHSPCMSPVDAPSSNAPSAPSRNQHIQNLVRVILRQRDAKPPVDNSAGDLKRERSFSVSPQQLKKK